MDIKTLIYNKIQYIITYNVKKLNGYSQFSEFSWFCTKNDEKNYAFCEKIVFIREKSSVFIDF